MFRQGTNLMREFCTPERVYALVRFLDGKSCDTDTLKTKMGLEGIMGKVDPDAFSYSTRVAEELDYIYKKDGLYFSNLDMAVIDNWDKFRVYTAKAAFSREDSIFFRTTAAFLSLNERALTAHTWPELAQIITECGVDVTPRNILGWRFWASFLGIGYIHGTQLIPNLYIRILDVLQNQSGFVNGDTIEVETFFSWLEKVCPEIKDSRSNQRLGLAVSTGLRILRDRNIIEIVNQPDAVKWRLYHFPSEGAGEFSHIRLRGAA